MVEIISASIGAASLAVGLAQYVQSARALRESAGTKRADEAPAPDRRAVRVLRTSASARVRGGDA